MAHAVERTHLLLRERNRIERGGVRRRSASHHVMIFAHDANHFGHVARSREHPAQEKKVGRLNGGTYAPNEVGASGR